MKSQVAKIVFGVAMMSVAPAAAMAHPGHGVADPSTPAHYALSFEHAAPFVALALVAAGGWLWLRSQRLRAGVK